MKAEELDIKLDYAIELADTFERELLETIEPVELTTAESDGVFDYQYTEYSDQ